jgi:hypothetical protein
MNRLTTKVATMTIGDEEKGLVEFLPVPTGTIAATNPDEKSHTNNNNKWITVGLIVFIGAAASAAFFSLGISR